MNPGLWRTVRRLRLASGLILFTYVTTHLLNHSLGLVGVGAMESGLLIQKAIWQSAPGTAALYAALAIHALLGLWSLYQRRQLGWTPIETLQLALGLAIPALLANHVFVTRIALTAFGLEKGYAQELHALWVASAVWGTIQIAVLLTAWTHGCIGLWASARLRRWYPKAAPWLLIGAVLLPVLALLGFEEGGRVIAAAADSPAWRATALAPAHAGTAAQKAALAHWRILFFEAYAAAIALILAARAIRALAARAGGRIAITYPSGAVIRIPRGLTVLDASRAGRIPHASVCGGRGRCTTCRIRVLGPAAAIPPPDAAERAILEATRSDPSRVRLACQLRPRGDIGVLPLVPPATARTLAAAWRGSPIGEERFVVALFVDMRGSTRFAQNHLPYDGVFLLGRFVALLADAVTRAGGAPNQFTGDGILALFGLDADPAEPRDEQEACRNALAACDAIAAAVDAFNDAFAASLALPADFGIGLHAGTAIVGEIGLGRHVTITAMGDPVNLASRLQAATRIFGCHALVSTDVMRLARRPFAQTVNVPVHDGATIAAVPILLAELASGGQGALPPGHPLGPSCVGTPSA